MPDEARALLEIVRRITKIESTLSKLATREAAFGNMRCLGGWHGDGPSPAVDHSSGSFVDVCGTDFTRKTYTKKAADTDLLFVFNLTGFLITSTSTVFEIGVQVDSTDFGSRKWAITPINEFRSFSDIVTAAGVGAGDHGIELRIRRSSGSGALRINLETAISILVFEVPAGLTFV